MLQHCLISRFLPDLVKELDYQILSLEEELRVKRLLTQRNDVTIRVLFIDDLIIRCDLREVVIEV